MIHVITKANLTKLFVAGLMTTSLLTVFAQNKVVPDHEKDIAKKKTLQGPENSKGIKSIDTLGVVALEKEFKSTIDRQLRARVITIEPDGVVAVHEHDARPGVAYILEGEIFEYRNGSTKPTLRKAGDAAFEKTGVSHWWQNKSGKTVRALVVDIIMSQKK